jgi:O-antigen/teichoic acid export membrane protein
MTTGMKPLRRIVELGAAFLCSNLARAGIGFCLALAIGRGLGADGFGTWVWCTTWASTLTTVADLGFGVLLTRDGARAEADPVRLVGGALALRLLVAVPLGAGLALASGPASSSAEAAAGLRIAALLGIAGAAYGCFGALFRSQPRWLPTWLSVETAWLAVQLAASWWFVRSGRGIVSLLALAAAVQVAQIATALAFWRPLFGGRRRAADAAPPLTATLRRALPFAAAGLVANLQLRVAPLLLGAMATPAELGWFGAASRVGRAVKLAPQAIFAGALPVLAHEYGRDRSDALRVSRSLDRALAALSVAAAAAVALGAAPLMRLLFGAPFAAAGPALVWIAIGLVPALSNSGRKIFLYAAAGESVVLRWSVVALAAQIGSAAVLIPAFGAAGAAASVALGEAVIWWPLRLAPEVRSEKFELRTST